MTTISAQVIEDSVSHCEVRLLTYQLRYPRWIHQEVLTHRAFARNASSSRAIPISRMNQEVLADPAVPLHIGKNQPGMQAHEQISGLARSAAIGLWRAALHTSVKASQELSDTCGVSKQVANRLTEAHQHINVVLSATDFENFFALRCHPDAEPHMQILAWRMADAYYAGSTPTLRSLGEWHLPYITAVEREELPLETLKACSAARCARVSYKLHDGVTTSVEKDLELHQRLLAGSVAGTGEPGHLSPLEHQATPLADPAAYSGPFRGWGQHRKEVVGENTSFDYKAALAKGWRDAAFTVIPTVKP